MAESIESRMFSIAKSIQAVENQASGFQDTMTRLSGSKFWTVISRSASGILPNFWSIQNKLRAVTDVFVMYYQGQERANKQTLAAIQAQQQLNESLDTFNVELITSGQAWIKRNEEIDKKGGYKNSVEMLKNMKDLRDFHESAMQDFGDDYEALYQIQKNYVNKMVETKQGIGVGLNLKKDAEAIELMIQERTMKKFVPAMEGQKERLDLASDRQIRYAQQEEEIDAADNPLTKWWLKQKHRMQNFLKLIGPVLRAGLKALKGALLWGTVFLFGLLVIVSMVKKIWPFIQETRKLLKTSIMMILDGVVNVLVGIKEIIVAALTGDFGRFFQGIGQVLAGVFQIFLGLFMATVGTVIAFALEFVLGGIAKIIKDYNDPLVSAWDKGIQWLSIIASAILIVVGIIALFNPASFMAGVAYLIGAAVVQAFASAFGRAGGGIVAEPLTLVGERGPELVSLPKGTQVHTNAESKQMAGGNTINVTVQGRIGASDAEIKDIANKVAHEINMRMNRTSTTPTRFA